MTGEDSSRAFTVTEAVQARLLTDPRSAAFFKSFLARELSVTQAARETDCQLNTMLYRVNTFVQAGLLTVTRTERRAGRAVKFYRSLHDAYFVPFALTPYATLEERLEAQGAPIFRNLLRAYAAVLRQGDRYGQHLLRQEDGVVWTTDFPPDLTPAGQPVVYFDATTQLGEIEARELGQALRTLFTRGTSVEASSQQGSAPRQTYALMVALLPVSEDRDHPRRDGAKST